MRILAYKILKIILNDEQLQEIYVNVRDAAYEIINRNGCYLLRNRDVFGKNY